jgi:Rab-like protein 5
MSSLKIVVAGPKGTGKSQLSNFLSGSTEEVSTERYDPTAGVRILEFDARIRENVTIELWDASGDHAFDGCWRAIMADADGVILIYNPDAPSQDQQIGDWFEFFVRKNGLKDDQCMVFAHRLNPTSERFRPRKFY